MLKRASTERPRWGFLGGSFDPVHRGHLALAVAARREGRLARVYFVPAPRPPHKPAGLHASDPERLALLRRVLRGRPWLRLGLWEFRRRGPSFTYQTLRDLRRRYPGVDWVLIIGEDSARRFPTWRRAGEILRRHTLLVGGRREDGATPLAPAVAARSVRLRRPLPTVSSTGVRRLAAAGRSLARWVPPGVASRIRARRLYRER
jgi:nicotinate-nucleotide adenylyltransferase